MTTIIRIYSKEVLMIGLALLTLVACERDLSEDAEFATFSTTAEIFTDNFIGMGTDFYFPFAEAKADVFSVDDSEGYESDASIRIDVPNADDPAGGFAGGIFRIDGNGRDLTGYDALTFWAKASQGVEIGLMGFGEDFIDAKYLTTVSNVSLGTNWAKYVIPIPDPSKLIEERGMFIFSAGGIGPVPGEEFGYSFWIDELKFESLGTIAHGMPAINNGQHTSAVTFNDVPTALGGLTQTFNVDGSNQTVSAAPSYFDFQSSDIEVARFTGVDGQSAIITTTGGGVAEITAILAGVKAEGSLTIESLGNFSTAPNPEEDPTNVISVFSDAYSNVPVDSYNGFFDFQTTLGGAVSIGSENVLNYTNLNFVTATFANPTIDVSSKTLVHVDIFIPEAIDGGDFIRIELVDFGPNSSFDFSDAAGSVTLQSSDLVANAWNSFDLELDNFTGPAVGNQITRGLIARNSLAQITFVSDATISSILVDNIYFY